VFVLCVGSREEKGEEGGMKVEEREREIEMLTL
jgi:hypothetical protein